MTLDVGTYYLSTSSSQIPIPIYRNGSWFANGILENTKKGNFKVTEKDEYRARITVQAKATVLIDSLMCSTLENAEYEPYTGGKPSPSPDYPQEIKNVGDKGNVGVSVTGKNLLPNTVVLPDKTDKGIVWTYKSDGVYHISGTSLGNLDSPILQLTDFNLPPGTYRMINSENAIPQMVVTKSDGRDYWYSTKFTIEKGDKIKYWYCGVLNGKTVDTDVYAYLEFDTGIQPTKEDFEPYKPPQTITLALDRPLTKWDRLEKREGVWGIARQGKTKVLKAAPEEEWAVWADKQNAFFIRNDKIIKEGLCSHFKAKSSFEIGKETGIYLSDTIHLIVTDMNINSLENWKTWLQANPITVTYKTYESNFVPLPQSEQDAIRALKTYYPTTVISNDENAGMEVSYVADTKNYINQKIDTINAVLVNTQKALL